MMCGVFPPRENYDFSNYYQFITLENSVSLYIHFSSFFALSCRLTGWPLGLTPALCTRRRRPGSTPWGPSPRASSRWRRAPIPSWACRPGILIESHSKITPHPTCSECCRQRGCTVSQPDIFHLFFNSSVSPGNEKKWAEIKTVDCLRTVSYTHLTLPTTPYV